MTGPTDETTTPDASVTALRPLADDAVALADRWAAATQSGETAQEAATTRQLASLLSDPAGLDLAVRFVDRVIRPEDDAVAARELASLSASDASFLGRVDRSLLRAGALAARVAPRLVVPVARARMRQMVGHLLVDSRDPALGRHLAAAREQGFRLNINLLGEAVLGEDEAARRTDRTRRLLERPDVDYVSIKVSSLVSQIVTWDTEGTVTRCLDRLRPLYRVAAEHDHKFVNLDMEEYRDLDLTLKVFERMLSEEEFHRLEAGIVLQAYLPDALPALERLIGFAQRRQAAGGAGIKVRLVKGANLAMEQVEAELHHWPQAPYETKAEVDASYLRCVERALRADAVDAGVRIGVASHNLYDVAAAHLLAEQRGVTAAVDVEMLQGMSPAQARAVRDTVGTVILYTPVVDPADFDAAVSYLVRRLEENATPENFLHAFFAEGDPAAMPEQERRFRQSITDIATTSVGPRREAGRAEIGETFAGTPDSDPALPANRDWAARAVADEPPALRS